MRRAVEQRVRESLRRWDAAARDVGYSLYRPMRRLPTRGLGNWTFMEYPDFEYRTAHVEPYRSA